MYQIFNQLISEVQAVEEPVKRAALYQELATELVRTLCYEESLAKAITLATKESPRITEALLKGKKMLKDERVPATQKASAGAAMGESLLMQIQAAAIQVVKADSSSGADVLLKRIMDRVPSATHENVSNAMAELLGVTRTKAQ